MDNFGPQRGGFLRSAFIRVNPRRTFPQEVIHKFSRMMKTRISTKKTASY